MRTSMRILRSSRPITRDLVVRGRRVVIEVYLLAC